MAETDDLPCANVGEPVAEGSCCEGLVESEPAFDYFEAICKEPADCACEGERYTAEIDCCEGLSSDFTGACVPCIPLGETRGVDSAGCCEGLVTNVDQVCVEI